MTTPKNLIEIKVSGGTGAGVTTIMNVILATLENINSKLDEKIEFTFNHEDGRIPLSKQRLEAIAKRTELVINSVQTARGVTRNIFTAKESK